MDIIYVLFLFDIHVYRLCMYVCAYIYIHIHKYITCIFTRRIHRNCCLNMLHMAKEYIYIYMYICIYIYVLDVQWKVQMHLDLWRCVACCRYSPEGDDDFEFEEANLETRLFVSHGYFSTKT